MPSPERWTLQIDPDVLKAVKKIPSHDSQKLRRVMRQLPENPHAGDIQKMKGVEDVWRRRVGAYRLFYKLLHSEGIILVFRLERRTSTTY